jgi:hypothetical protein
MGVSHTPFVETFPETSLQHRQNQGRPDAGRPFILANFQQFINNRVLIKINRNFVACF